MSSITSRSLWASALVLWGLFSGTQAARQFNRRSDPIDAPPVSESGWLVPLQAGRTCRSDSQCETFDPQSIPIANTAGTDSLTPPEAGKTLAFLTVARGSFIYTCEGNGQGERPRWQSQSTQLYDAAPIVPLLPNEESFHAIIPQLYDFDYGQLKNSTLHCIGTIGTVNDTGVVTLFEVATFELRTHETILSPGNPALVGKWAHSFSPGRSWEVYRVEMEGGAVPTCADEPQMLQVGYAAEYWFYHSGGEDLKTQVDGHGNDDGNGNTAGQS